MIDAQNVTGGNESTLKIVMTIFYSNIFAPGFLFFFKLPVLGALVADKVCSDGMDSMGTMLLGKVGML